MFLIRAAFWLSLVIMLIPTGESNTGGSQASDSTDISAYEAISVAQTTVSDLAGFCDRNPQTCETGSAALKVFGQKAQYGARKLYEYIAEANSGGGHVGSRSIAERGADTLMPDDKDIPWDGPVAQAQTQG
jgi:Family of unknown function (DUF5330)